MDFWSKLLLGATKPFRSGANILAKGYGDLYRGVSGNTDYVSPLEQYIREGITDEEAQNIEDQPYKEILKSGAGMAATLAPYSKAGLFTQAGVKAPRYMSNLNPSTNPLLNKSLQILTRGALEGAGEGYGVSRRGYEAQDTTLGTVLGILGEGVGSRLFDKSYKELLNNPDLVRAETLVNEGMRQAQRLGGVPENIVSGSKPMVGTGNQLSKSMQNFMEVGEDVKSLSNPSTSSQFRDATLKILDAIGLGDYPEELIPAIKRLSGTRGGEKKIYELVRDYATKTVSGM